MARLWIHNTDDAKDTTESVKSVFVGADSDGIDAHLDDGVVIPSRLGHVAEVEDVRLLDVEFLEKVSHTEFFVHAGSGDVDRGGAANLVQEVGEFFLAFGDDLFALFHVGVPSVFDFGAGFLTEGREGDLGEAVLDDFIARSELVGLPVAKFFSGVLEGCCDFYNVFWGERVVVDLLPAGRVRGCAGIIDVILSALRGEKMQMFKLIIGNAGFGERFDDLDEELFEFLTGDWTNLETIKALDELSGNFQRDGSLGNIEGLVDVEA